MHIITRIYDLQLIHSVLTLYAPPGRTDVLDIIFAFRNIAFRIFAKHILYTGMIFREYSYNIHNRYIYILYAIGVLIFINIYTRRIHFARSNNNNNVYLYLLYIYIYQLLYDIMYLSAYRD